MRKTVTILGFVLALACPPLASAQTVCTPRIGGGFDCHDYDTGTPSIITPRPPAYGIGGRPPGDRHHGDDGLGRYGARATGPYGPQAPISP